MEQELPNRLRFDLVITSPEQPDACGIQIPPVCRDSDLVALLGFSTSKFYGMKRDGRFEFLELSPSLPGVTLYSGFLVWAWITQVRFAPQQMLATMPPPLAEQALRRALKRSKVEGRRRAKADRRIRRLTRERK